MSGCNVCLTGKYATAGNGNTCAVIACTTPAYTGSAGSCTCAVGYEGAVVYANGAATGCTAITCTSTGYTGTPAQCTCTAGYYGTVTYTSGANGVAQGCAVCGTGGYCAGGSSKTNCLAGYYSAATTATNIGTCQACAGNS